VDRRGGARELDDAPHHDSVGTHLQTKRFRVWVAGPFPGDPAADGEFVMIVRGYGDRPG
jgi:hypothetical protein